jgi:hypothetical protein
MDNAFSVECLADFVTRALPFHNLENGSFQVDRREGKAPDQDLRGSGSDPGH